MIEQTKDQINTLINNSKIARDNAYAPYSKFKVGAALLAKNGKIYIGCNIENAAFGAGTCGERSAISAAISNGDKEFEAIAVISDGDDYCVPCGICRQALNEFAPNIPVYCCNKEGDYKKYTLKELLPNAFNSF